MGVIRKLGEQDYCRSAASATLEISSEFNQGRPEGVAPIKVSLFEDQPEWTTTIEVKVTRGGGTRSPYTTWVKMEYDPWFRGPVQSIYPDFRKSIVIAYDSAGRRRQTGYLLPKMSYHGFRYLGAPPPARYFLEFEDGNGGSLGGINLGTTKDFVVKPLCSCRPDQIQCGSTHEEFCCIDCSSLVSDLRSLASLIEAAKRSYQ